MVKYEVKKSANPMVSRPPLFLNTLGLQKENNIRGEGSVIDQFLTQQRRTCESRMGEGTCPYFLINRPVKTAGSISSPYLNKYAAIQVLKKRLASCCPVFLCWGGFF